MRDYLSEFAKDQIACPVTRNRDNLEICLGVRESDCHEKLFEEQKKKIRKAQKASVDILLSSEGFDNSKVKYDELKELLSGFDIKIVVVYRRFFEWLISLYGERKRQRSDGRYHFDEWGYTKVKNIKEWLADRKRIMGLHGQFFSSVVYDRYKLEFNTSLVNFHASGDVVEEFFCLDVLNATVACSAKRKHKHHLAKARVGVSPSAFSYDEIVVAGYKSGLLDGSAISRADARKAVQKRQEQDLNLTSLDFPTDCLADEFLQLIENVSIAEEQRLLPSFFNSNKGEMELRAKFVAAKNSNRFCGIDTEKLLLDPSWKQFLSELGDGKTGYPTDLTTTPKGIPPTIPDNVSEHPLPATFPEDNPDNFSDSQMHLHDFLSGEQQLVHANEQESDSTSSRVLIFSVGTVFLILTVVITRLYIVKSRSPYNQVATDDEDGESFEREDQFI